MDVLDKYIYSINLENTTTLDREHSPYFCNQETPKMPDQNNITNNNSFEFSQGFNPGLTLDKYFGGNFKVIQLQDMEVDETFDIYTRGRKLHGKNKSYHCRNDSRNKIISSPNDLSLDLIRENDEFPFKLTNTHLEPLNQNIRKNESNIQNQTTKNNQTKQIFNDLPLKNVNNNLSFRQKNTTPMKRFLMENKNMSPCFSKDEQNNQKENTGKTEKLNMKQKELLKSYQLAQLLKKENPENHITFRKITHSLHKKPIGYLGPLQKPNANDPLAEYSDLGMGKTLSRLKNSFQVDKKIKCLMEIKDTNFNKIVMEQPFLGKCKGISKKELTKKFVKKQK